MIEFVDYRQYPKDVKKLYYHAFPCNERVPYGILKYKAKSKAIFQAVVDQDKFIGLIYLVIKDKYLYLFFLAVDDKYQNQGYGSKIIKYLKEKYHDYKLMVLIEDLDELADNHEQRVKRFAFYKRNGLIRLNYKIIEAKVKYELIGNNENISDQHFYYLMDYYFGKLLFNYLYKDN